MLEVGQKVVGTGSRVRGHWGVVLQCLSRVCYLVAFNDFNGYRCEMVVMNWEIREA